VRCVRARAGFGGCDGGVQEGAFGDYCAWIEGSVSRFGDWNWKGLRGIGYLLGGAGAWWVVRLLVAGSVVGGRPCRGLDGRNGFVNNISKVARYPLTN
jgi:hypothetical protein